MRPESPWWNRSMHYLPDAPRPGTRLLVPVQKLGPFSEEEAMRASMRPAAADYRRFEHSGHGHHGGHGKHSAVTDDLEAAAASVAAAPLVWKSWPVCGLGIVSNPQELSKSRNPDRNEGLLTVARSNQSRPDRREGTTRIETCRGSDST